MRIIPYSTRDVQRKSLLIDLSCWAIHTGRAWLVVAVDVAIAEEGLSFA